MLAQSFHNLYLLFWCETDDSSLDDAANGSLVNGNEAKFVLATDPVEIVRGNSPLVVHEGKETHDELTVHTIRHTTMARNGVTEILDVEGALQTGREETAEWSNERGKCGEDKNVELHGSNNNLGRQVGPVGRDEWQLVCLGQEDGVDLALEASEDIGSKIIDWTDKVFVAHQEVGQGETEKNGETPSSEETFDSLLGADLDQLCAAKGNTANVCKDIVGDDERCGKEEPDHALEDVVHDEVCLHDNEIECHVCPCELGELELVVSLFKRYDEEDEACMNQYMVLI